MLFSMGETMIGGCTYFILPRGYTNMLHDFCIRGLHGGTMPGGYIIFLFCGGYVHGHCVIFSLRGGYVVHWVVTRFTRRSCQCAA